MAHEQRPARNEDELNEQIPGLEGTNSNDLPNTADEAINNGVKILQEMEFRSVRAAQMAYIHSDKYENKHFVFSLLAALATVVLSSGINVRLVDYFNNETTVWAYIYGCFVAIIAAWIMFLKIFPDYILPLYVDKFEKYNRAGAGWQKLEFSIRAFLATKIRNEISPSELLNAINDFAEERRKVCEIARPKLKIHIEYEENPYRFVKYKADLKRGLECYNNWGFDGKPDPPVNPSFFQRCRNVPIQFLERVLEAFT